MAVTCNEHAHLAKKMIGTCIFNASSLLLKDFELSDESQCTDELRILGCRDLYDHAVSILSLSYKPNKLNNITHFLETTLFKNSHKTFTKL